MNFFFKSNWKFLLFPLSLSFIIIFDYYFEYSIYVTLIKITVFSLVHLLFVLRTKYLFDSDIIRYYASLKAEFESGYIVKSALSPRQSRYIYYFYYFISLLLLFSLYSDPSVYELIILNSFWHVIFFIIFFTDFSFELYRLKTNTSNLSKIPVPTSLSNVRFFSGTIIKFATIAPTCAKASSALISGLALSEIAVPTLRGGFNRQGPLTNYYLNSYEYDSLACPIETRADTNYENAYHGYEKDVREGVLSENPLPKRTRPIRRPSDLVGLSIKGDDLSWVWLNAKK